MNRAMAQVVIEPEDLLLAAIAERRLALRVPVALAVGVRDGFRSRRGVLLDLSLSGARLRFEEPVTADRRPWLWIPAGLGGRLAHPIGTEVAWTDSLPGAPTGHCQIGLHFRRFPFGGAVRIRRALAQLIARTAGPVALDPPPERRSANRVPYDRRVIARGAGAPLVMLGRDLSAGGIRVETRRALAIGDEMHLALHAGGSVPLVLRAQVARSVADGHWVLAFKELSETQRERLDSILIEQVAPQASGTRSLLVSEVAPEA
jgi:hypothetical protein